MTDQPDHSIPESPDGVWRFKQDVSLERIKSRLRELNREWKMLSVTASYYFGAANHEVVTYEASVEYLGGTLPDGDPLVAKTFKRNSYSIARDLALGMQSEQISESEFYEHMLYSDPDRLVNLQQLVFSHEDIDYIVELNLEAGTLVLLARGDSNSNAAKIFGSLIGAPLSQDEYLSEIFGKVEDSA